MPALLTEFTSKINGDFYYLNCIHYFRTINKLKSHKKVCENKDFCGIIISSVKKNISEFDQYMKSVKMPYIFHADLEFCLKEIGGYAINPEKSSTTKIDELVLYVIYMDIRSYRK